MDGWMIDGETDGQTDSSVRLKVYIHRKETAACGGKRETDLRRMLK